MWLGRLVDLPNETHLKFVSKCLCCWLHNGACTLYACMFSMQNVIVLSKHKYRIRKFFLQYNCMVVFIVNHCDNPFTGLYIGSDSQHHQNKHETTNMT